MDVEDESEVKNNKAARLYVEARKQNPELFEEIENDAKKRNDGFIFSPELRKALKPFGKMDIRESFSSPDFLKALAKHAGMTDSEFENIMGRDLK